MGSSHWSDEFYYDRAKVRAVTGVSAFAHHDAVSTGKAKREVHAKLNPMDVLRESRDSTAHPESLAIGVVLDVTGSMCHIPKIVQENLPKLLKSLDGVVKDPQILFGAVGDATCDQVPLQVGQFESGIEMDDDLSRFWLEGGGGGNAGESYELALYFFARHTVTDCFEKRGKKGFLFIVGDEPPLDQVNPAEVKSLIGAKIDKITTEAIVKECQKKYNIFFLIPDGTSHAGEPRLQSRWASLLGPEHVIHFNANETSAVIARQIGIVEGTAPKDVMPKDNVVRL
jgi:hypothetical protein